jgi:hypothetical protein
LIGATTQRCQTFCIILLFINQNFANTPILMAQSKYWFMQRQYFSDSTLAFDSVGRAALTDVWRAPASIIYRSLNFSRMLLDRLESRGIVADWQPLSTYGSL